MRLILISFISILFQASAQDEEFFREFFAKRKLERREQVQQRSYDFQVASKMYRYDLDGDGLEEAFQTAKRDAQDWFYLYRNDMSLRLSYQFETMGRESYLYKIRLNNISDKRRLLTLYFYEGFTEGHEFYGTTRLYFITFLKDEDESIRVSKGPRVWLENNIKTGYIQRNHIIKIRDLDLDGEKEVVVSKGHITRVYKIDKDGVMANTGI